MAAAVIAFANNKGGSGKSTCCANVGYCLALRGRRVLLVDGDMQMNLTLSFFDEDRALAFARGENNLYTAIRAERELTDCVVHTAYPNLDLLPSSTLMSGIECDLFTKWQRETVLRRGLERLKNEGGYDYILIDAPPTLGCWVMNILCAADRLVIPVEASPWGLFGLANMFDFLRSVQKISPELSLLGIVITKADVRKNYYKQTRETLAELPDAHLFRTVIHVDSAIEWSQDNSMPVVAYKRACRAAQEYILLTEELEQLLGSDGKAE